METRPFLSEGSNEYVREAYGSDGEMVGHSQHNLTVEDATRETVQLVRQALGARMSWSTTGRKATRR